MSALSAENVVAMQIKLIRKYLKLKIMEDNVTFRNHSQERTHVYDLIKRCIVNGESNSALIIGPRGCGKTTLINSVLSQLSKEVDLKNDAVIIRLDGLVHHDDKTALKAIAAQMQIESTPDEKVHGSFADHLSYLVSCLRDGSSGCRSAICLLDQLDAFCHTGRTQTLLYNLLDATRDSQTPVCVLGITNRIDVMELLEKRVKSRFSHRHIFVFPNEDTTPGAPPISPLNTCKEALVRLLSVPTSFGQKDTKKKSRGRKKSMSAAEDISEEDQFSIPEEVLNRCKVDLSQYSDLDPGFVEDWNAHISSLVSDEKVVDMLDKLTYYTVNEQILRNILFQLVSQLSPKKPFIDRSDLNSIIDKTVATEHRVKLLQSLSILELCLIIAMKHSQDIFDGQPFNFEMILHRYTKFANTNASSQSVPRPVILKAFEHLQALELIAPVRCGASQREHALYALAAPAEDAHAALASRALPTDVAHWWDSDIM